MILRRHPGRRRLRRWLDGDDSDRITRHVECCCRCQSELEALSVLDEELVEGLDAVLRPPPDVSTRTRRGVEARLRDEAGLGAFVDLFAVAADFVRLVVDDTPVGPPATADGDTAQTPDPPADEEQR